METIIRKVRDIDLGQRQALEQVVGRQLKEDQQIILQIITPKVEIPTKQPVLPEWCNVFAGLADNELAEAENIILQRTDLSRSFK